MNTNVDVKSDRCFEWSFERNSRIKSLISPDFFFAKRRWYFEWSETPELPQESPDFSCQHMDTSRPSTEHSHKSDLFKFKPRLSMRIVRIGHPEPFIEYTIMILVTATSNINRRIRPRHRIHPTKKTSITDCCFEPFNLEHTLTFSENQNNITSIKICFHFSDKVIVYSEVSPKSSVLPEMYDPCYGSLLKDMSSLLSDSSLTDLKLKCKDGNIKAHKAILCARSKVFAAMLQSSMVEHRTGEVKIRDMYTEDFKKFLQYIYTGTLPDLTMDVAIKLYEASDMYEVLSLKWRCARILAENVSQENACDLLVIADAHSDEDLKKEVISFILSKNIYLTKDIWIDFLKRQPVLAGEVLTKRYFPENE